MKPYFTIETEAEKEQENPRCAVLTHKNNIFKSEVWGLWKCLTLFI